MPQPRFPAPSIVKSGDTLHFDLLVNSSTGQKIGDYVTVAAMSPAKTNSP